MQPEPSERDINISSGVGPYGFLVPGQIRFGWGTRREIGELARPVGRRAFVISGSCTLAASGVLDELRVSLAAAGVAVVSLANISHEPMVEDVDRVSAELAQQSQGDGDFVIGIGGGSAIDLAKAVAAMATNRAGHGVLDYLEGVGAGLVLDRTPLPFVAIPTTGGTGSEATKNAVISRRTPAFKKSLRSDNMSARLVIVDPELSLSVPARVTAQTGMDAITQLIESFISRRRAPLAQALALEALPQIDLALVHAVEDGACREARERMSHAALVSGIALANSGLGMAHGVAAALGIHCDVPHGLACAVILPIALRANRDVCQADYARLASTISGRTWPTQELAADALIETIDTLVAQVGIPRRLSELGVEREQIGDLVRDSRGNSMSGNPRELSDEALHELLVANW